MAMFLDLPDEILVQISDYVLPADLINFCCSYRRSYRCSEHILPRFRQMSKALHNINDQDPLRLLGLLHFLAFGGTENSLLADPGHTSTCGKTTQQLLHSRFQHL